MCASKGFLLGTIRDKYLRYTDVLYKVHDGVRVFFLALPRVDAIVTHSIGIYRTPGVEVIGVNLGEETVREELSL